VRPHSQARAAKGPRPETAFALAATRATAAQARLRRASRLSRAETALRSSTHRRRTENRDERPAVERCECAPAPRNPSPLSQGPKRPFVLIVGERHCDECGICDAACAPARISLTHCAFSRLSCGSGLKERGASEGRRRAPGGLVQALRASPRAGVTGAPRLPPRAWTAAQVGRLQCCAVTLTAPVLFGSRATRAVSTRAILTSRSTAPSSFSPNHSSSKAITGSNRIIARL
jgi:hypothetical protein